MTSTYPSMEEVDVCPLCQSRESRFLFANHDRLYELPGEFGTIACASCGLIRISPRPTVGTIGIYYPEDYGAYQKPTGFQPVHSVSFRNQVRDAIRLSVLYRLGYDNEGLSWWQKTFSPIFSAFFLKGATFGFAELFPRRVAGGKALEIGCGNGAYLNILKKLGWEVVGADLSPHAAESAKKDFDIDVYVGELELAPFEEKTFDYIHLSHVVEHFYDPLKTMKMIHSLLKPGGWAYVEVPNAGGTGAKVSKELWYGWDPPRHLFMFTPETIEKTIIAAGLEMPRIRTRVWNTFDWAETYATEERTGKHLEVRPSVDSDKRCKVSRLGFAAHFRRLFNRLDGDLIACAAKRPLE